MPGSAPVESKDRQSLDWACCCSIVLTNFIHDKPASPSLDIRAPGHLTGGPYDAGLEPCLRILRTRAIANRSGSNCNSAFASSLQQRLAKGSGTFGNVHTGGTHRGELGLGSAGVATDDRAGVAHALAFWCT